MIINKKFKIAKGITCIIICALIFSCKDNGVKSSSSKNIDTVDLLKRANYFYAQEEYLQAKQCYDTLISKDSSQGEYFFKRGYSKSMLLYDVYGAIADYQKAIEVNYNKKQKAYLNIGVLLRSQGKYDSAIIFINQCLKLDPNNPKALREKEEITMQSVKKIK